MRRCPACNSSNVRRSSIRGSESGAHAFRSPYRCERCNHRFWVVSRRTRLGVAAATIGLATGIVVAAGMLILPDYVPTPTAEVGRDIEEWSSPPMDVAGAVLTPKGLAAGALQPNESLGPGPPTTAIGRLLDGRR